MVITEDGANSLIAQFGEEVEITETEQNQPEDSNDPIYFESSDDEVSSTTKKVRLYTTPSKETLEEYGFEGDVESMMYSTEDIASQGDEVIYSAGNYEWYVGEISTNQLGSGPYLFVYELIPQ